MCSKIFIDGRQSLWYKSLQDFGSDELIITIYAILFNIINANALHAQIQKVLPEASNSDNVFLNSTKNSAH